MTAKTHKIKLPICANSFRQKLKKAVFPQIIDDEKLFKDKSLKPIKLISAKNISEHSKAETQIHFELYIYDSQADVYLYLNGSKSDMFYSISSGKYHFNVNLDSKKNEIELYYLLNSCKSPSVFKTITRK